MFLRSLGVFLSAILIALATFSPAISGSATSATARNEPHFETWAGGDGGADGVSVYGGMVAALFGDVRRDGWRLRADGGWGIYGLSHAPHKLFAKGLRDVTFRGWTGYADILLGYQKAWGPLIVKAYAGWTEERGVIRDTDMDDAGLGLASGTEKLGSGGFKGVIETWLALDEWGFLQTDLSWSEPQSRFSGRTRLGYRLNRSWSVGPEAALYGDADYASGRVGGFVRLEGALGEVSVSAGLAGDREGADGGYGSISALMRF
ncbi:MAG: cellulose biosynthesis protein BcsS [Hyphomicrobiaceae bacterium]